MESAVQSKPFGTFNQWHAMAIVLSLADLLFFHTGKVFETLILLSLMAEIRNINSPER